MKSTLYMKFVLLYAIFGFLSLFTVSALSSTLTSSYLEREISGNLYQEANLVTSDYLPRYFSEQISTADVYTQLNGMRSYLDSTIWFVDKEGNMIASAKSENASYIPSYIEDFDPAEAGSSQYLIGDYHGYFD